MSRPIAILGGLRHDCPPWYTSEPLPAIRVTAIADYFPDGCPARPPHHGRLGARLHYRVQHIFIGDRAALPTSWQGAGGLGARRRLRHRLFALYAFGAKKQALLEPAVALAANPLLPKAHRQYASALPGGMTWPLFPQKVLPLSLDAIDRILPLLCTATSVDEIC